MCFICCVLRVMEMQRYEASETASMAGHQVRMVQIRLDIIRYHLYWARSQPANWFVDTVEVAEPSGSRNR